MDISSNQEVNMRKLLLFAVFAPLLFPNVLQAQVLEATLGIDGMF